MLFFHLFLDHAFIMTLSWNDTCPYREIRFYTNAYLRIDCYHHSVYSGARNVFLCYFEYVCPHRAGWNVCLTTVGFKPATFGLLVQRSCQLSYEAKSVRMNDISKLTLSFDNYMFLYYYVITWTLSQCYLLTCGMYCGVALSVCAHRAGRKNHGRIRTRNHLFASTTLLASYQLSYEVKSVCMNDISKLTSSFDIYNKWFYST